MTLQEGLKKVSLADAASQLNPPLPTTQTTAEKLTDASKRLIAAQEKFSKQEKITLKHTAALEEVRAEVLAATLDIQSCVNGSVAAAGGGAPKMMRKFGTDEQTVLEYFRVNKGNYRAHDVCLSTGITSTSVFTAMSILKRKGLLTLVERGLYTLAK